MARNTQVSADHHAPPVTDILARHVAGHASRGWNDAVEHEALRTWLNWVGCAIGATGHESVQAANILRAYAPHLLDHGLRLALVVEVGAVIKTNPVAGIHRPQVHVIGKASASQRPELLEKKRRGHDGGTGIKGEAVLREDARTPARLIEPLKHRHPIALAEHADGAGEATTAATDDHHSWRGRRAGTTRHDPRGGGACLAWRCFPKGRRDRGAR